MDGTNGSWRTGERVFEKPPGEDRYNPGSAGSGKTRSELAFHLEVWRCARGMTIASGTHALLSGPYFCAVFKLARNSIRSRNSPGDIPLASPSGMLLCLMFSRFLMSATLIS